MNYSLSDTEAQALETMLRSDGWQKVVAPRLLHRLEQNRILLEAADPSFREKMPSDVIRGENRILHLILRAFPRMFESWKEDQVRHHAERKDNPRVQHMARYGRHGPQPPVGVQASEEDETVG